MKNPRHATSWDGIKEMTEAEKQVVDHIVNLYIPEDETAESAVVEGAIVIEYDTFEAATRAAKAFEAHDFENVKVYKNKPAIRVPFTHEYTPDEVEEARQEYDGEDVLDILKSDSMEAMLTEVDAIASFIEENEAQTTGYINKAELTECEGTVSGETKKKYIYAFNLGRVNARESVKDLTENTPAFEGLENIDKVIRLGQFVTKTQAFENTELGKLIESALPNLIELGQAFLGILF